MAQVNVTKNIGTKTLTIESVVNGPKDKVWKAYADREWFEKWWGPEGWQTTTKEFSFAPGGRIHYGMTCVDEAQGDWFNQTSWGVMTFESIDDGDGFVASDAFSDENGAINAELPAMVTSVALTENDGKTTIVTTCQTETVEQLEELVAMGMAEGWSSQLEKLSTLLA